MYDSLAIGALSLHSAVLSSRNSLPQSLGQAGKDGTIGVHKFPESARREPVGISIGLGCRLELFLDERFGVVQRSSGLSHHRGLGGSISDNIGLTVGFKYEPPFRAMPRGRSTHQGRGDGRGNPVSGRRTLHL